MSNDEIKATTRFGKETAGWWFGVWQDDRLVAFGAGYRDKRRCFKHQRQSFNEAMKRQMPEVECETSYVLQ